jgi:pimeloyl-ACP methyl ester carboxylesterase
LKLRNRRLATMLAAALLSACATGSPVGVTREDPRVVQRELTESALTGARPSARTRELLTRLGLRQRFERDPGGALAELRAGLEPEGDADRLFALAELSFLRAQQTRSAGEALAAAVYAYAFLFAPGAEPLDPFDPRVQIARHLYNRGLTRGLQSADGRKVEIGSGSHEVPFGTVEVRIDPQQIRWAGWQLERFVPAADLRVRGLQNRYRHAGIGAPLSASLGEPLGGSPPPGARFIPASLKVPVTAFLRVDGVRAGLASGRIVAALELYDWDERPELEIEGSSVPLERETSSSLAHMLEGSPIWNFRFAGFRLGDFLPEGAEERLVMLSPYRPGRIPLVLIHGTFSSPATWAELVNELENDPEISRSYQPWLFVYPTGNPIPYSAGLLVETLRDAVSSLDPEGRDPALRQMVIVGHSQGGLLARLAVADSGDAFWRDLSQRSFDEVELAPESRALLQRSLFFQPLPFVRRVVFIATPHRGSELADRRLASWVSRFVKMPVTLTQLTVDLARHGSDQIFLQRLERLPTSLDNMSSRNPFLRTLSTLPIAPEVATHSIIAVRGGPDPDGGDGVVRFRSARLEGVESELVIDAGHSVHTDPQAIQELRRILLVHAAAPASADSRRVSRRRRATRRAGCRRAGAC